MNWKEQLIGLHRKIQKPYRFTDAYKNAIEQDEASRKAIYDFISKEIIEKLIADIPEQISAEVGWVVKTPKLKQQLKDKWL